VPVANSAPRNERNTIVHGAHILYHLKVIRFIQQKYPSRRFTVTVGFRTSYRLSATEYGDELERAPNQVTEALNMSRDLRHLHIWTREKNTSKQHQVTRDMTGMCDLIIDAWKQSLRSSTAYPEDGMTQIFNNLTTLYTKNLEDGDEDC
jgi:hypothetical protein